MQILHTKYYWHFLYWWIPKSYRDLDFFWDMVYFFLAYESRAWIEAKSHWNEYDQIEVWGLSWTRGRKVKNSFLRENS